MDYTIDEQLEMLDCITIMLRAEVLEHNGLDVTDLAEKCKRFAQWQEINNYIQHKILK